MLRRLPDPLLDRLAGLADRATDAIEAAIFERHRRKVERALRAEGLIDRDGEPTEKGKAWLHGHDDQKP